MTRHDATRHDTTRQRHDATRHDTMRRDKQAGAGLRRAPRQGRPLLRRQGGKFGAQSSHVGIQVCRYVGMFVCPRQGRPLLRRQGGKFGPQSSLLLPTTYCIEPIVHICVHKYLCLYYLCMYYTYYTICYSGNA